MARCVGSGPHVCFGPYTRAMGAVRDEAQRHIAPRRCWGGGQQHGRWQLRVGTHRTSVCASHAVLGTLLVAALRSSASRSALSCAGTECVHSSWENAVCVHTLASSSLRDLLRYWLLESHCLAAATSVSPVSSHIHNPCELFNPFFIIGMAAGRIPAWYLPKLRGVC